MKRAPLVAGAAALCAAVVWYVAGSQDDKPGGLVQARFVAPWAAGAAPAHSATPSEKAFMAAQTRQALERQADDLFLTPELRLTLEAMLFEVTEANDIRDPEKLKKLLIALVPQHFAGSSAARATQLIERYVDYRVALGDLKPPADPSDPRALRSALDARQNVRQRHFSGDEYEALFAEEARLDRYTVARLEIERSNLTAAQKKAALSENDNELSPAQRTQRDRATAHLTVAAQTAALNASSANDFDRYAQRRAQYGEVAATQLAQLDREDRDWQARLNDYARAQAEKASPEQLRRLSQQLFSAQEQLRFEAALAARQLTTSSVAPMTP